MPITLVPLPPDNRVGPGLVLRWQSDAFGPFPTDTFWLIDVKVPGVELGSVFTASTRYQSNVQEIVPYTDQLAKQVKSTAMPALGTPVNIDIKLQTPTGIQDTGGGTATWDPTAGLGYQIQQLSGGTGAQPIVHAELIEGTAALTGLDMGGNLVQAGLDLLTTLGSRVMSLELIGDFTGPAGRLTVPGIGPGGVAFGIAWQIVSFPDGLGVDEAQPLQLEIPYLELSLEQSHAPIGATAYQSEWIKNFNGIIEWGLGGPITVGYYVLPGVSVRLWWLKILVSPDPWRLRAR